MMPSTPFLSEPARNVPIVYDCDVCVLGGSTTGLFAAVAAARLGAKVALVEALGYFGGTATASLVCIWHSLLDTKFEKPIMAGLVSETLDRLRRRNALLVREASADLGCVFSPWELVLILDEMVAEQRIRPFLYTRFVAPILDDDGRVQAAVIEDKTGRRAIQARFFIDATGDADLIQRLGQPTDRHATLQPPTTCAVLQGLAEVRKADPQFSLGKAVFDETHPEALRKGFLWGEYLPGLDTYMVAGTRVHGADCSDADQLTEAEIEGRRQVRAILDVLRKYHPGGDQVTLQCLPARIGIRDTRHARCRHTLTEQEVLSGQSFTDAIANGSYRVDIHFPDRGGLMFRYLDGREEMVYADRPREKGRWRGPVEQEPTFYQIPYRSLVPQHAQNVLVAGRCLDADVGAFGAVRVMVNAMQTGQAAGVAGWLALDSNCTAGAVDTAKLRELLKKQGAVVL